MASLGTLSVNIGANTRPLKQGLDNALGQAKSFASGVLQTFTGLQLSSLFSGAVQQIRSMALGVVNLAAEAELAKANFATLLMDVDKGAKLFADLEKFAARTSFSVQSASEAATMLLAKGITEADIIPTMQLLGDLAMGNAERLGFLAKAYTDVQAKGKLMAQEQNQFAENGINLFELLAKTTGKNVAELMAMREAGQITFGMVQKALITATSEGGKFYGALEKANATFTGQWNSLIEGVQTLGRMIGEAVLPRMTQMVTKANEILQVFVALPNKVEFLGNVFIAAVDVALAYLEQEWPKVLSRMAKSAATTAQDALMFANPVAQAKRLFEQVGQLQQLQQGRDAPTGLQEAQGRLAALLKQLQPAGGAKAADPLQALRDKIIEAPKIDLGAAIGSWIETAKGTAEPIANAVNTWLGGKLLQFDVVMAQLFGSKAKMIRATDPMQKFAGAVQKGSSAAFEAIRAAIEQNQDPVVEATEQQTDKLLEPLGGILAAVKNGFVNKVVGNLLD